MHHSITIGGLLLSIGLLAGLALTAFGLLELFAGGMSDAPQENAGAGCLFVIVGVVLLIVCALGFLL